MGLHSGTLRELVREHNRQGGRLQVRKHKDTLMLCGNLANWGSTRVVGDEAFLLDCLRRASTGRLYHASKPLHVCVDCGAFSDHTPADDGRQLATEWCSACFPSHRAEVRASRTQFVSA